VSARITRGVVGGVIGAGIVWLAFNRMGPWWGAGATLALLYEGWTLANGTAADTISEIIRWFSRKQLLIPWLFGFATGVGIATMYVSDPYVLGALLLLQGHWFFTLDENRA
jgi:hypothetical protein